MDGIRKSKSDSNLSRHIQKDTSNPVQQKKPPEKKPETPPEPSKEQPTLRRRFSEPSIPKDLSKLQEGVSGFADKQTKPKGPPGVALGVPPPPPPPMQGRTQPPPPPPPMQGRTQPPPPPPPMQGHTQPPPPPPMGMPPPSTGVRTTTGAQTPTVAAAKPLSEMGPNDTRVKISYADFKKLMAGENEGQFKVLRERITQVANPTKDQPTTAPLGHPKGEPNFRLDIEGVPNRNKTGTEQLSVMFRKDGPNSVRMRAYQGEPSVENQNQAILDVKFNSTNKSAHLDWVGKREASTPCNLSGNTLMKSFAGLMKASGYKHGDLSDVSGLPIDRKQPDIGLVKLKVTGAYNEGKTWYMGFKQFDVQGASDPEKWRSSAKLLKETTVSNVLGDLGTQTKRTKAGSGDDTDSSGMNLRQLVDHFTPKIVEHSKHGENPLSKSEVENLPVGKFYGKMLEVLDPGARPQKPGEGGTTTELRMAHDFYKIAMERDVETDPNHKAAEAAKYIRDTSEFNFTVK